MSNTAISPQTAPAVSLDNLATEIVEALRACRENLRSAVQHALRAGELLLKAKEQVPHGEWQDWLRDDCHVGDRQAQKFMKLARDCEALNKDDPDWIEHLTINGAIRRLRKLLDPAEEEPPAPNDKIAEDSESEEGEDATFEAELEAHKKRCQRLKRFMPKGTLAKTDLPVAEAVEKRLPKFTRDVVNLARKHGELLCKGEKLKPSNVDGEMVGMVLFNQIQPNSANHFAPLNEPLAE